MTAHSWFVVAVVLFIIAGAVTFIERRAQVEPYRYYPFIIVCAGLACLAAGFVVTI